MRIAMLSLHTSPMEQPGAGDAGGMNVYIRNLAYALSELGHEVHLVTRSADPTRTEQVMDRVWMHELQVAPGRRVSKDGLYGLIDEAAAALREHFHDLPVDVIHAHYWLSGMLGLELATAWHIPLVVSLHTSAAAKEAESGIAEPAARKEGERHLLAAAQRVIANTPVEAEQLRRHYRVPQDKLDVVLPGVEHEVFHPPHAGSDAGRARSNPARGSDLHLVYAGRMQRLKGAHLLLQAIARARQLDPGVRITAELYGARSGAGDYDPRAIATRLALDEVVHLAGPLPPRELAVAFAAADLVAVPSLSETFGLVAAEAQACGTPVIANRVGGLNYSVADGVSGWLIPEPEPEAWARQLLTLARDPQLLASARAAALAHSARFTWRHAAQQSLQAYRRAGQAATA